MVVLSDVAAGEEADGKGYFEKKEEGLFKAGTRKSFVCQEDLLLSLSA